MRGFVAGVAVGVALAVGASALATDLAADLIVVASDEQNDTIAEFWGAVAQAIIDYVAGAAGVSDGDKGDVVVSGAGAVWDVEDISCTGCVDDADVDDNITIDLATLATTATTANAGDSATAFFAAGTLEQARGGTGAGALTCGAGDFLTSNGTVYSCGTPSGGVSDGDKGDITVSAGGATWLVDSSAVDFSELAGTVSDTQIAAGAVDGGVGGEIADGSVTADDLGADSVSASELNAPGVAAELEAAMALQNISGTLDNASGGTGQDTSITTGVPRISAGVWSFAAGVSHLAASTSSDLRSVLSDETGTGAAMFGLTTSMADDIGCSGSQQIRRNAGDAAWECFTPSSGGASAGTVLVDLGTSGDLVHELVVTTQTWVTGSSVIVCNPFGTTVDGQTPETVAAAALEATVSDLVAGTGFTIRVYSPHGATGLFRFHCVGVG